MELTCNNCQNSFEASVVHVGVNDTFTTKCPYCEHPVVINAVFDKETNELTVLEHKNRRFGVVGVGASHASAIAQRLCELHPHNVPDVMIGVKPTDNIGIVGNIDRDQFIQNLASTRTLNKIYHEYLYGVMDFKMLPLLGYLDEPKQPKTDADYLIQAGIRTFDELNSEMELINQKKSKLSSVIRKAVKNAYEHVTTKEK